MDLDQHMGQCKGARRDGARRDFSFHATGHDNVAKVTYERTKVSGAVP